MTYSKNFLWLMALIMITVVSCSKDDDGNDDAPIPMVDPNAIFVSALIDGEEYFSDGFFLETSSTINEIGYAIGVVSTSLNLTIIDGVSFAFAGIDFDEIANNTHFVNDTTSLFGFTAQYSITTGSQFVDASSDEVGQGTVTSIDTVAKVFSGTFSFVGVDAETNTSYSITNGVFQNIAYED